MLGDSIDTRNMQVDYSPIAQAGATMGNAFNQVGADIGGMIKLHGENDKYIKTKANVAKAIMGAFPKDKNPEMYRLAEESLAQLHNPGASQHEKLAVAQGIDEALKIGLLGKEDSYTSRKLDTMEAKSPALFSTMTGPELDAYTKAGYDIGEVDRLPNGNFRVGKLSRKPPSAGGFELVAGPDNQLMQVPKAGQNFAPTPYGGAMPSGATMPDANAYVAPVDGSVLPPRQGTQTTSQGNFDPNSPPPNDVAPWPVDQYGYAAGPAPQAAPQAMNPFMQAVQGYGKVPREIPLVNKQGQMVGATQVEGSFGQQEYLRGEATKKKDAAEAELAAAKVKTEADKAAETARKLATQKTKAAESAAMDIQDIKQANALIEDLPSGEGLWGSGVRYLSGKLPGSVATKINGQLSGMVSRMTIGNLQEMRQNSPTGASVGNPSDKDMEILRSLEGQFDPSKITPKQFKMNLVRAQNSRANVLHGTPEQRANALRAGTITPEQNAIAESDYADYDVNKNGDLVERKRVVPIEQTGLRTPEKEAQLKAWEAEFLK
jgi:hypothetical protein